MVEPIFDDFGDIVGGVLGIRAVRKTEPVLADFTQITKAGIVVLGGEQVVSFAEIAPDPDPAEHGDIRAAAIGATASSSQIAAPPNWV